MSLAKPAWAFRPALLAGLLGAGFAASLLGGCAPDLGPMPQVRPMGSLASQQSLAMPAADWPTDQWWRAYGDPQLDALEAEALAGSPDLTAAAARVRQAAAAVESDRASLTPQAAGNAQSQTTKQSLNEGFPDNFKSFLPAGYHTQSRATLDLEWDLDLFGANRARIRASRALADAQAADAQASRLQLTTSVAGAYAQLARLYADLDAAVAAVRVRSDTVDLVGQRLRNGLETRGELATAQGGVPEAQAQVLALDRQILVQRHALAALLGAGPDRGLAITRPAPLRLRSFGLPSTATTDLIGRRPDIAFTRERARAAALRVKGAKADFYPTIAINGDYGLASLGADKFFDTPDSVIGALGPSLRLPIFSAGRLEGALRARRGEYDEAVAAYDRTLINALRDVADAAAVLQLLNVELANARQTLSAAEEAYRIARLRYTGGLSPYLNVLTAEGILLNNRRNVADLEASAAGLDVDLVRALGGGFRDPSADRPILTASR